MIRLRSQVFLNVLKISDFNKIFEFREFILTKLCKGRRSEKILNFYKMETETSNLSLSQDMFADSDEEEEISFRGTEFSELKRHAKSCSNWRESRVFFQHQDWTKPFPSHSADIWDNHHVRLPWSNCNEFPIDGKIVKRYRIAFAFKNTTRFFSFLNYIICTYLLIDDSRFKTQ